MQCKSDKYDVIAETMGPKLNEGLCSMLKDDRKTPRDIQIYYDVDSYFIGTGNILPRQGLELATVIPSSNISIAVTGDLAFYATMLGKPSMGAAWCTWCNLKAREWSVAHRTVGDLWTRDKKYWQILLPK